MGCQDAAEFLALALSLQEKGRCEGGTQVQSPVTSCVWGTGETVTFCPLPAQSPSQRPPAPGPQGTLSLELAERTSRGEGSVCWNTGSLISAGLGASALVLGTHSPGFCSLFASTPHRLMSTQGGWPQESRVRGPHH